MKRTPDLLKRYEPVLFCLVIVVNLFPVLFTSVMFSLDGPAHTYNAAMLKGFITGHPETVHQFLYINKVPVPNWSGHLLMAFFQFFVSPVLSEKLLVITMLVLTPFSFRYLVRSFSGTNMLGSYFIFALTYNAFQVLGFYNFLLALVPAFYLVGYLVRHLGQWKRGQYTILSSLLVLIYFSHVFVYLLCLLMMVLVILFHVMLTSGPRPGSWISFMWKQCSLFLIVVLPSGILLFCFYLIKPELTPVYLDLSEIIEQVKQNSSLVCFEHDDTVYTQPLLLVFMLLTLGAFGFRLKQFVVQRRLLVTDIFPLLLLLLLVLLFTLPDSDGWAGYYTLRTLLLLNLFMLLWSAVVVMPGWLKMAAAAVMLFYHGCLIHGHYTQYEKQQPMLRACVQAGSKVEQGKPLLTINLTGNWRYGHMGSQVAAVNQALLLRNYEAGMNYFPLKWQMQGIPTPVLKNGDVPHEFIGWPLQNTGRVIPIDYIFVMGELSAQTSEGFVQLKQALQNDYEEVFNKENCHLFKIKK